MSGLRLASAAERARSAAGGRATRAPGPLKRMFDADRLTLVRSLSDPRYAGNDASTIGTILSRLSGPPRAGRYTRSRSAGVRRMLRQVLRRVEERKPAGHGDQWPVERAPHPRFAEPSLRARTLRLGNGNGRPSERREDRRPAPRWLPETDARILRPSVSRRSPARVLLPRHPSRSERWRAAAGFVSAKRCAPRSISWCPLFPVTDRGRPRRRAVQQRQASPRSRCLVRQRSEPTPRAAWSGAGFGRDPGPDRPAR